MSRVGGALRAAADSLGLAVRGLWWRKGVSLAVLLVAATTVLAAAIGPLYARAGSESILQDTLRAATTRDVGIEIYVNDAAGAPLDQLDESVKSAGPLVGYREPVHSLQFTGVVTDARRQADAQSLLAYRDGQCGHLAFTAGGCPQRSGEVAVSARSLPEHAWQLGARIDIHGISSGFDSPPSYVEGLRVVGLYRPKNPAEGYWFDQDYFNAHITACSGDCPNVTDSIFTPQATFDDNIGHLPPRALLDLPLDIEATRLADVPRLRQQLARFESTFATSGSAPVVSNLGVVLDSAKDDGRRLVVSVGLVVGQLLLLSWFVLYLVVANASEVRGPEVALAKLRGLSAGQTVAFGLLEPLLLLLLATPVGLVLGLLVVVVLGRLRLLPGTPVALTPVTALAVLAALAGAVVAATLAARGTLRRPVVEQWRRTAGEARPGRGARVIEPLLVLLATAGLVVLWVRGTLGSGRATDAALVAPALVALILALFGVRLLPLGCRLAVGRTRGSRRIGRFIALRQVARRPGGLRIVALLSVAFALTTFAVAAWSVSSSNRSERAATEVGAASVLKVDPPAGVDLVALVRRLDPNGRAAMAAAEYQPFSGEPGGRLLAVDSERLAALAAWRRDFADVPLRRLAEDLRPRTAPPVTVTGSELGVDVVASSVTGSGTAHLVADLRSPTLGPVTVSLGRLRNGAARYAAAVPACAAGCRLAGLSVTNGLGDFSPRSGQLLFTGLVVRGPGSADWRRVDAGFATRGRWTSYRLAQPVARSSTVIEGAGLRLTYEADLVDMPGISPADTPALLPALLTPVAVPGARAGQATTVTGLDGQPLLVKVSDLASVLPRVGGNGTLLDLEYAGRALGTAPYSANREVWLSATAPADFADRLRQAGVQVLATETTADRQAALGRQGPALALLLFLCAAALAALLAAGATVVSVYLAGRRRAFELAAMGALGVPRTRLLRACLGEQLLLLLTGVGVGAAAGVVGAALTLTSLPIYSDAVTVPPLHYVPSTGLVGGVLAAAAAVIAATGALAAVLLVRSARPARLREAQA